MLQSGGRGVPCWRDPRVPLQLVGASTTSNQPSLPSSWRGEWANKTSDSSNSNQSSHPAEPVHCVKIQIKSNLWVGNQQSLTYRSCHSHSSKVSSNLSFGPQQWCCTEFLVNSLVLLVSNPLRFILCHMIWLNHLTYGSFVPWLKSCRDPKREISQEIKPDQKCY